MVLSSSLSGPTLLNMRRESHKNGREAELAAELFFTERGFSVSYPSTEERYDFIVDIDGELLRVQVKCGYVREQNRNKLTVDFRAGTNNKPYSKSDIDGFVIYNPETEELYWENVDDVPDSTGRKFQTWRDNSPIEQVL